MEKKEIKTRSYEAIPCAIWDDPDFLRLSDTAQKVFFYLLVTIHSNLLGIFVLKEGYALADLPNMDPKKYRTAINEIISCGLIDYDAAASVVLIKKFHLTANPIINGNQIKAIQHILRKLPKTPLIFALKDLMRDRFVAERGLNRLALDEIERLVPGNYSPDGKTLPRPEDAGDPPSSPESETLKENASALVIMWNNICGEFLGEVSELTRNRMKHIKTRLKERNLNEWEWIFQKVVSSQFLTGHGEKGWKASFDWVIGSQDNVVKIVEGKYDDGRFQKGGSAGIEALRSFAQATEGETQGDEKDFHPGDRDDPHGI